MQLLKEELLDFILIYFLTDTKVQGENSKDLLDIPGLKSVTPCVFLLSKMMK